MNRRMHAMLLALCESDLAVVKPAQVEVCVCVCYVGVYSRQVVWCLGPN